MTRITKSLEVKQSFQALKAAYQWSKNPNNLPPLEKGDAVKYTLPLKSFFTQLAAPNALTTPFVDTSCQSTQSPKAKHLLLLLFKHYKTFKQAEKNK